jgi:ABC-2 type transport system permease protein
MTENLSSGCRDGEGTSHFNQGNSMELSQKKMKPGMFRILLGKYLQESLALGIPLALILMIFPWIRIWTISQFELSGFGPLIEQFKLIEKFSPVPLEQFLTYPGIIGLTYDEPVLLLCLLAWSISRGSDVVSGELGRGTMEMLLAQPIRRWQVLGAHAIVSISGLVVLCLLVFAGMALGIGTNSTPVRDSQSWIVPWMSWNVKLPWSTEEMRWVPLIDLVDPMLYAIPTLNLFALGFAVLGLSVAVSSFDQYRWRSVGVVIGIYVLQLLLFILSKSTPSLGYLKSFTFLAAYQPDWIVRTTIDHPPAKTYFLMPGALSWEEWIGPMGYASILMAMGVACYGIAFGRFQARDLPAPQ